LITLGFSDDRPHRTSRLLSCLLFCEAVTTGSCARDWRFLRRTLALANASDFHILTFPFGNKRALISRGLVDFEKDHYASDDGQYQYQKSCSPIASCPHNQLSDVRIRRQRGGYREIPLQIRPHFRKFNVTKVNSDSFCFTM